VVTALEAAHGAGCPVAVDPVDPHVQRALELAYRVAPLTGLERRQCLSIRGARGAEGERAQHEERAEAARCARGDACLRRGRHGGGAYEVS
jgi:hypothetical protein